jgi:hypothetical protein
VCCSDVLHKEHQAALAAAAALSVQLKKHSAAPSSKDSKAQALARLLGEPSPTLTGRHGQPSSHAASPVKQQQQHTARPSTGGTPTAQQTRAASSKPNSRAASPTKQQQQGPRAGVASGNQGRAQTKAAVVPVTTGQACVPLWP